MRDIQLEGNLLDLRSVLVLLIPAGSISKYKFQKYSRIISSHNSIDVSDLYEVSRLNKSAGGFENRNWTDDKIYLCFDQGETHSEWENLFLHKKPLAVIGIADCSAETDLHAMNMLFILRVQSITSKSKIQAYNGNLAGVYVPLVCLGFELRPDQKDPDLKTLKVIPDQDSEHFNFYLSHIISEEMGKNWINHWELAVQSDVDSLVDKITSETGMEASSRSLRAFLKTPLDNEVEFFSRPRRRNLVGRIRKQHADLCLMSGSRIDAIGLYELSVEISKSCSEWEWVGAGYEGWACAILSKPRVSRRQYQHASSKLQDAARYYRRKGNAGCLEAECLLRLGRLCVNYDRPRVYQTLQRCHALSNEFAYPTRIKVLCSIASIYELTNWRRKFVVVLTEIAYLCYKMDGFFFQSKSILAEVEGVYCAARRGRGVEGGPLDGRESRLPVGCWYKLQASFLMLAIDLSMKNKDRAKSLQFLAYFLREVAPHVAAWPEGRVGRAGWAQRVDSILTSVTLNSAPVERALSRGIGLVRGFSPVTDSSMRVRVSRSIEDPTFLYRPNRRVKDAIDKTAGYVFAWPEHASHFDLELRNSLDGSLRLEGLYVELKPVLFRAERYKGGTVEWDPPVSVCKQTRPIMTAEVVLLARQSKTVRLAVRAPRLRCEVEQGGTVLLCLKSLHYTVRGYPFTECLVERYRDAPRVLSRSLHYVDHVPELSIADERRLPCAAASRAPELDSGGETHCEVQIGEFFQTDLLVRNCSVRDDVDELRVDFYENGRPLRRASQFSALGDGLKCLCEEPGEIPLPLKGQSSLTIPMRFEFLKSGRIEFSIRYEYRNSKTGKDVWRTRKIDWVFVVSESLKIEKLSGFRCSLAEVLALRQLRQNVVELFPSGGEHREKRAFVLFSLSVKNPTAMVHRVALDRHPPGGRAPLMIDPFNTKDVLLIAERSKLLDTVNAEAEERAEGGRCRQTARTKSLADLMTLRWSTCASRSGHLRVPEDLVDSHLLSLLSSQGLEMEIGLLRGREAEARGEPSTAMRCNEVTKVRARIQKGVDADLRDHQLSFICIHAESVGAPEPQISWIGQSQMIDIHFEDSASETEVQVPLIFHHPGVYCVVGQVVHLNGKHAACDGSVRVEVVRDGA